MKHKWLGAFLFAALVAGFASCYGPCGYRGYSDYYPYGRGYYSHGEHMRHDRGRPRYRVVRSAPRKGDHASKARLRGRLTERDRRRW